MDFKPIENVTEEEKEGFLFLFSKAFIDPVFNPSGIIDGFYQDGEGWIGAVWNTHDGGCWKDTVVEPTHYCLKVKPEVE